MNMELLKSPFTMWLLWVFQHIKHRKSCRLDYMSRVENSELKGNNRIYRDSVIKHSTLGKHSYIGRNSHIQYAKIGNYCSIGANVLIGGGIHPVNMRSTHPALYDGKFTNEIKEVVIGHDVWIGQGAIILDGVKIGDGAIIASGSVVNHNVRPFKIVGGVPASAFGERKIQDRSFYHQ